MNIGYITEVDSQTGGLVITSSDGNQRYSDASMILQGADFGKGSYNCSTLSPGTPCIYEVIDGEAVVFGAYMPPNLSPTAAESGFNDSLKKAPEAVQTPYVNRQQDDFPKNTQLPGDWMVSGSSGSEVSLRDMLFSVKMSKAFFSVWNSLNSIWDNACNKAKFRSPGVDVLVDVDEGQNTNLTIIVRKAAGEREGTPAVELKIGKDANLIKMKVKGKDFLSVDDERNVLIQANNMEIQVEGTLTLPD